MKITFLRSLRQSYLNSGKLTKYLFYALGEIFLVVLGILIALQVNTWNNSRLDLKKEREILLELKEGLQEDAYKLDSVVISYERDLKKMHKLDSLLTFNNHPYHPDMDDLFGAIYGIRYVRVNQAYFEELKNNGIHLIRDAGLKKSIVNLFEETYDLLRSYLDAERSTNQVVRPYYLQNFVNIEFYRTATPVNYDKIWNDPYYKNIVHYRIITLELNHVRNYGNTVRIINQIVEGIDNYLEINKKED